MTLPAPKDEDRPSGVRGKTLTEFMHQPPRKRYEKPAERTARVQAEMQERAKSGEWSGAGGEHLVALYEFLHREVYGVEVLELDPKTRAVAARVADSIVKRFFEGDCGACVSFMRWVWKREMGREEWRRANGRDGQRIVWRLQFAASLVTDYRVNGERARGEK